MTDGALAHPRRRHGAAPKPSRSGVRDPLPTQIDHRADSGELVGCGMLLAVDRESNAWWAPIGTPAPYWRCWRCAPADTPGLWTLHGRSGHSADMGDVRTALVPIDSAEIWSALVTPASGAASATPSMGFLRRPAPDSIGCSHRSTLAGSVPWRLGAPGAAARARIHRRCSPAKTSIGGARRHCRAVTMSFCAGIQAVGRLCATLLFDAKTARAGEEAHRRNRVPSCANRTRMRVQRSSHFSRRFLQYVGATPRSFRWSAR